MIEGVGNMEPATTIWELWDSDKEGPGMNSRNHHMFASVGGWLYKTILGIMPSPANATIGRKSGFHHVTIGPDTFIVNNYNTTSASGRLTTPYGILEVQWDVTLIGPLVTCQAVAESSSAGFYCGNGLISAIQSAFYGNSTGDCSTGFVKGKCDSATALQKVSDACLGQNKCQFNAGNDFFGGDPCSGVMKHFDGMVTCSSPSVPNNPYLITVVVPMGTSADVLIPIVPTLKQSKSNLMIYEGTAVIWQSGQFLGGVDGISDATFNDEGLGVVVSVTSGKYSFLGVASQ